jgi:hypothetical protein
VSAAACCSASANLWAGTCGVRCSLVAGSAVASGSTGLQPALHGARGQAQHGAGLVQPCAAQAGLHDEGQKMNAQATICHVASSTLQRGCATMFESEYRVADLHRGLDAHSEPAVSPLRGVGEIPPTHDGVAPRVNGLRFLAAALQRQLLSSSPDRECERCRSTHEGRSSLHNPRPQRDVGRVPRATTTMFHGHPRGTGDGKPCTSFPAACSRQ